MSTPSRTDEVHLPAGGACENSTLRTSITNAEVPAHFDMVDTRREEPFAVAEGDDAAGACAPTGEPDPNACAGERVYRTFWHIVEEGRQLVGYDDTGGYGSITERDPDFPTRLCEDLSPLG